MCFTLQPCTPAEDDKYWPPHKSTPNTQHDTPGTEHGTPIIYFVCTFPEHLTRMAIYTT